VENHRFNSARLLEQLNTPLARSIFLEALDVGSTLLGAHLTSSVSGEMNPVARGLMEEHGPVNGILIHETTRYLPMMYGVPGVIRLLEKKLGKKIQRSDLSVIKEMMGNYNMSDVALDGFAFNKLRAVIHNVGSLTYHNIPEPWNKVAAVVSGSVILAPYLRSVVSHYSEKLRGMQTDYSISECFEDMDFSMARKIRKGFDDAREEAMKRGIKPFPDGEEGLSLYYYHIQTASQLEKRIAGEKDETKLFGLQSSLNRIYRKLDGTSSPYKPPTVPEGKLMTIYDACKEIASNSKFD